MIIKEYEDFIEGSQYNLLDPEPIQKFLKLKGVNIGTDNSFTNNNEIAIKRKIDCIEMEAASLVRICHLMNVPFTAIKIVSDVEMEDQKEREKLFQDFFANKIKELGKIVHKIIENIDDITKQEI
ncbi:phosphorylase family protein, putative [Ichthyophthirius multifiliis]|uniref:Phosphorylase family protein, putative n=1 Tax=Ichthyophthirius multifiliis TaxID=5932 RepID=G0QPA0_ICHMU|nr:phosphorylase family protein, putative [Ichthyophthirius multifiliis]EGR32955.1 phosphorylase family protein, putative [Ichthyophthirius multifiliis]|eukprot:XP_004036941.1 phosphorylase family protein, putative [Ichthyophthirius multifiliis]